MATKYEFISSMAREESERVAKNGTAWMDYLKTAARLYKYPFNEQLLIYAQRPDATACASIEIWNDKMNCWVNRGAKGIALIDVDSVRPRLKYVFDVSDVHKAKRIGRDPNLWHMKEEHQNLVIRKLEMTYGATDGSNDFEERIKELADRIATDYLDLYAEDLGYNIEGSSLEELDEQNRLLRLKETMASSIAYTVLSRCGADVSFLEEELNFDYISDFNTMETLSVLGNATTEMCKPVLMEIGRTIEAYERNQARNARVEEYLDNHEKNMNLGLANAPELDYNALKRESKSYIEHTEGDAHETDIREERGLSGAKSNGESGARTESDEIRTDEKEIPEGTQGRDLSGNDPVREAESTSVRDSEPGRGENGTSDQTDGTERRSGRSTESQRAAHLGSENEQHPPLSGRGGTEGADLQLNTEVQEPESNRNHEMLSGSSDLEGISEEIEEHGMYRQISLFPSVNEQLGTVAVAQAKEKYQMPAAFSLAEGSVDDILRTGGGREHSRKRIIAKYQQGKTPEEMAAFLKKEYETTGKGFEIDGKPISVWFDPSGMKIGYGTSALEQPIQSMDWNEVESHIRGLVEAGTYMTDTEAFLVDSVERGRLANHIYIFFRDGMGELPEVLNATGSNYPDGHASISDMLGTPEGLAAVEAEMDKAIHLLDTGEKELRFQSIIPYDELRAEVADLHIEKRELPFAEQVEIMREDFITQDEIDRSLNRGSGFSYGSFRIYDFFQGEHDAKEAADYLKSEYGTSGRSHALAGSDHSYEDHDAKGIKLKKGDIFTPNAEVLLNWNTVQKRIRELVTSGKYLSEEGIERYQDWKAKETEKAMQREHDRLDHMDRENCKRAIERVIASDFDGTRLPAGTADKVISQFGQDRVELVLAYTILNKEYDGRFSGENREWAKSLIPDPIANSWYMTVDSHPAVVNGFVNQVKRSRVRKLAEQRLKAAEQDTEPFFPAEVAQRYEPRLDENDEPQDIRGYINDLMILGYTEEEAEEVAAYAYPDDYEEKNEPVHNSEVEAEKGESRENEDVPTMEADPEPEHTNNILEFEPEPRQPLQAQPVPQIDKSGAVNFHITNDSLGIASDKDKFHRNVAAIITLELIESENRIATPEEQEILSNYVGWGGLPDVFDPNKSAWSAEYLELKTLLSPEEYTQARESTLNAHYTSPVIIRSIYNALDQMGFEKGNVLEPAMGIGNFFGMIPENMKDSKLYGVELDGITGRIAKQLYPKADVRISGFEKTAFPNDFFDVAVGNVPFGQYKVADKQYDRQNFLIHDYFFAKTLDKVRPGGVVAFVTSKGTMDKKSPDVRKYLAQRAELLGAVRLPNTAFKENAGTEVTADILFLKKRDRVMDIEPEWVHLSEDVNGITMNSYFAEHPEMIAGKMEMVSGPYGMESTCKADTERPFEEQLKEAISHIDGTIDEIEVDELEDNPADIIILADPNVRNYSYTLVDDKVYYRENTIMKPADVSDTMKERIKGMVGIRDATQELINMQLDEYPDSMIQAKQQELNELYDTFQKKHGLINSQTNKRAFNQDSSYCLLCSLEKLDDEGNFKGKADMFSKRTIKKAEVVTSVDTSSEALAVSLGEKAKVDLDYMAQLTGKSIDTVTEELTGIIFQNPLTDNWETADEYLSGNVRDKLAIARTYAENHPEFAVNITALEQIQPKELDASEIEVRIGATWIDPKYIDDFMRETFQTPQHLFNRGVMGVQFTDVTGLWNIKGKNADFGNTLTNMTYGTSRVNAYKILEDSLNLKDSRVYDTIMEDGKEKRVLNKKETMIASQKQEAIREAFKDWIFQNPERRQDLVQKYNELFNSTRPREYDGAHLKFPGMTPDIELKPHQKNAVAHVLYGDNTLLAHCVGAGKTFEMTAAAMESKRLGLCQKSLFVVPNHLTEQWASDFLRLYPGANILAATKKDFEPANRKKFCSRIATGEYDAVIIGHSQFEKIPLSNERQVSIIERQITEIEMAIEQAKADKGERYTIKQMEKTKKSLKSRLDKLNDGSRKDNVVTFEQLGVDRLFVDESHNYKNLFLYTKMRNVAGIAQTEAQKSSDMFAKCQYLDELTGGKGVTFATGTPISNSMTELYTNMRYLQYGTLQKLGLGHFDSWAASFGETQTAIELAPEGTGYRAKTRFAKFFNLPELISLFKESADIQTPDMLKLPVPEAEFENVVLKPSEAQKGMVQSLADRAEAVRDRRVDAAVDNMLKITNDGRKLALDQRLVNDMLPDDENSKSTICVDKAFEIWNQTKDKKATQLIFCDLSTPKNDGKFNVYEDIRQKLIQKGVPKEEIAFIHEANTELRKAELFGKVRSGQVRFLLGSTAKMGAGTNVQDKLIALHHMDVPWRPSDIEQQEGRILRQGNTNEKVKIFRYVTEGTFDSYSWQLIENKQKFIGQIMTSKSPVRSCEDIDEAALSYAEVKALATGNPYIKEKMDIDIQVSKLKLMKANHTSQKYRMEDNITQHYPHQIAVLKERITGMEADIATYQEHKPKYVEQAETQPFMMRVGNKVFDDRKEAGTAIIALCKEMKTVTTPTEIGEYLGMKMSAAFDAFSHRFVMNIKGMLSHNTEIGSDPGGNISRINHVLESMTKELENAQTKLSNVERQLETAKGEVEKPFAQETELAEKLDRLAELNALLNMDEKGENALDVDDKAAPERSEKQSAEKNPTCGQVVHKSEAVVADKPAARVSLKEKLESLKAAVHSRENPAKTNVAIEKAESR